MTDTPKVGQLIKGTAYRDAVHIAIYPVEAACPIRPGSHVRLTQDGKAVWVAAEDKQYGESVGIADPFLVEQIQRGQRFYVFVYPGTVTSLRHAWTAPWTKSAPVVRPVYPVSADYEGADE